MAYNKKIALSKNVAAIELAFRIEAEKRKATPKEIQVLNQYSGFGGLKCVLYNANEEQDRNKMAKTEIDMFDLVKHLNEVIRVHTESAADYKLYMDSIRSSVQTAFYTPVFIPKAIGTVLNNVGVLPQKVLDPSAGSGVFGQTLSRIWPGVTVDCFEKDLITAKILAAANPDFKVKNTGFEKISVGKVDSYDLVTSNIPFGNFKVYDILFRKSGDKAKLHSLQYIHDYFFLKAIDSLRPGGILAFVTSKGIADSPTNQIVRESMVKQCRLLSAVRFPNDLFMEGSGISVASDLILLQKRIPGTDASLSVEESAFTKSEKGEEGVYVNSFFTEYPDNMLVDRVEIGRNQFGQLDYNYSFSKGQDILEEKLLEVLSDDVLRNLSEKDYRHMEEELKVPRQKEKPPVNKKEVVAGLSFFDLWDAQELEASVEKDELVPYHLSEESLYWHQEGMLGYDEGKVGIVTQIGTWPLFTPIDTGEPQFQLLKDYIGVRDAYGELYYAERDALKEFPKLRDRFNQAYDLFRAKYGALNEKQNQKVFMKDSFQMVMQSLELYENGQYIKGTLFHEPVAFKPEILPTELSPTEGLLDSSNRTITGKFKNNEPHIYITLTNSHFDPRDCSDIGYLTAPLDYNGEIPDYTINSDNVKTYAIYKDASGYAPVYVQANSYSDNEFLGWYDGNANLLSTFSSLEEREISEMQKGTSIFAKFSERQSTSDESYTINVVARSWDGSWHFSPNGFVGFDSNYTKTTIIAKHGDTITVYAEGKTGNDDSDYGTEPWWYYVKGFYTPSHSALLTFNDVDKYVAQYTFEAKMNQDIYVEFVYYKR